MNQRTQKNKDGHALNKSESSHKEPLVNMTSQTLLSKSIGRGIAEHHAEKIENLQTWGSLECMFRHAAQVIIGIGQTINHPLSNPDVCTLLQDNKEIVVRINGIKNDLMAFTEELAVIHEKHIGLEGVIRNQHDLAKCYGIAEDYISWTNRFTVVLSNAEEIARIIAPVISAVEEKNGIGALAFEKTAIVEQLQKGN
jgi:hypothetical protein